MDDGLLDVIIRVWRKNYLKIINHFISTPTVQTMENNDKNTTNVGETPKQSSFFCKYFGNAFIRILKENQIVGSQKLYYLNILTKCNDNSIKFQATKSTKK